MSDFLERLKRLNGSARGRRWAYIPCDQLSDAIGVLAREKPGDSAILLIESHENARRRPYHRQRLALLWSNQRHFALEQCGRGVFVEYVISQWPISQVIESVAAKTGPLEMQEAAERELRFELTSLVDAGILRIIPHEGWLTRKEDLVASASGSSWRMDAFYRHVRRDKAILMEHGKPVGGKYSFDAENRLPWKGRPAAPKPPSFPVDEIKEEVAQIVIEQFSDHPGTLDLVGLPASSQDAERLWTWAKNECLPYFGPYEDAMSSQAAGLFHTRISSLINIHRILPRAVLDDAMELAIPLASKEAFIRQVLGWREFVYHVHCATDGFRLRPEGPEPVMSAQGDGGYGRWSGSSWTGSGQGFGGACPSVLGASNPLPMAWWGKRSGLNCLDTVIADVWRYGWSHHITRLMVIANLAALLDVSPRELTDWFWIAYTDAYDWVVEPNVLGMGTFAVGDLITTKPYVSGASYINKMSDYCEPCQFDPSTTCPVARLYWAYLDRHAHSLSQHPRMRIVYAALRKRNPEHRAHDQETYKQVLSALVAGEELRPN